MKGNEIQMNLSCHLLAAQLASIQGGGSCSSSVGFGSSCYSCPPCCQAISSGLHGNDLWDERRKEGGGKLPPTVPSPKNRKGNYMLNGSTPHRLVQIVLNKLLFGSILSPQN